MKRILILLSLLAAIGVQAQGCIKGTVTDAKTGEPLPFVNVCVFQDGKQVHGGATDLDGIFTIKPLAAGKYDVEVKYVGYERRERKGVVVKPDGFTLLEVKLTPSNIKLEEIAVTEYFGLKGDTLPLTEYEIVDHELKALLDRVIEGKEHTYFWRTDTLQPKPKPEGTTFNLYLFSQPSIDTSWDSYLYMLYSEDPSLPRSLEPEAPTFSFDSTTTCVQVVTTYYPETFSDGTLGFVAYRGRIFFLQEPSVDERFFRPLIKESSLFRYKEIPAFGHRDPETWIYTHQQGHWYRWMEYPNGF